uniref:Protein ENHANCED DISEASE RESISTANCE 2 C-terminal domain-containing protein n=1 Tax=Lactuca sativa TaxID=4236 RepID=A0A9R1UJE9_LACSA|nr:hypothetical protein LSAT_V11C900477460 [Lactuca sativa]
MCFPMHYIHIYLRGHSAYPDSPLGPDAYHEYQILLVQDYKELKKKNNQNSIHKNSNKPKENPMISIDWKFWRSYLQKSSGQCVTIQMLGRVAALRELVKTNLSHYLFTEFTPQELKKDSLMQHHNEASNDLDLVKMDDHYSDEFFDFDDESECDYIITLPEDKTGNLAHSWSSPEPSLFPVCGQTFLEDRKKITVESTLLKTVGADWLKSDKREDQLAIRPRNIIHKYAAEAEVGTAVKLSAPKPQLVVPPSAACFFWCPLFLVPMDLDLFLVLVPSAAFLFKRLEDLFNGRPFDMLDATLTDIIQKFPLDIKSLDKNCLGPLRKAYCSSLNLLLRREAREFANEFRAITKASRNPTVLLEGSTGSNQNVNNADTSTALKLMPKCSPYYPTPC